MLKCLIYKLCRLAFLLFSLTIIGIKMKKILFLLALASFAVMCFAQNGEKTLRKYGYWDNWFIQWQAGGQYTFSECQDYSSFSDKLSPAVALNVGKFFSPEVGTRIQFGGWTSKNNLAGSIYNVNYLNGNIDALFNMSNIFHTYKGIRNFNLIGILGVGVVHTFEDSNVNVNTEYEPGLHTLRSTSSGAIRAGLQADFRLSEAWSLNVEANANLLRDDFNGQEKYSANNDATLNVLIGLTYRFNKRGFAIVEAADPMLIQSLNDQNNALRLQVKEYKARCESKEVVAEPNPIVKEAAAEDDANLIGVVVFRTGKAVVESDQEGYLYNTAQYIKEHPKSKFTIASYSNTDISTANMNLQVSEKRSAAVFNMLKDKYQIPASRLTVVNYSGGQRPLNVNNIWNKINIFISK